MNSPKENKVDRSINTFGLAMAKAFVVSAGNIANHVQLGLDTWGLENCNNVETIRNAYQKLVSAGELESPVSSLLRSFSRISEDVDAALNQESATHLSAD